MPCSGFAALYGVNPNKKQVSAKCELWFPIQPTQRWGNFLRGDKKVKISNFISWFCLKDKLLEQKLDTAVSCPDTEVLWKMWGKTDSWFLIQPTKNCVDFFQASQKVKISNFMGFFYLKDTLVQPRTVTGVSSCVSLRHNFLFVTNFVFLLLLIMMCDL